MVTDSGGRCSICKVVGAAEVEACVLRVSNETLMGAVKLIGSFIVKDPCLPSNSEVTNPG
jgi:hypothetical protein